jgi:hypothetical protein
MIELKVNFAAVDSGECKDIYTDCSLVMQTAGRHPCNIGYVRDGCKQTCGLCSGICQAYICTCKLTLQEYQGWIIL